MSFRDRGKPFNGFKEEGMRGKTVELIKGLKRVDKNLNGIMEDEKKVYKGWKLDEMRAARA